MNETQTQPIHSELGILSRSDGSAVFCQGETIAIASVYGPAEAQLQKMLIEKAHVQVHFRPKTGLPGVNERLQESVLRNTCETALIPTLYPRTTISVVIQELQNCGGLLSCAVNAACLALLDSGTEMKFLIAAVHCMLNEAEEILVSPGHLQLEHAKATLTFVFDSADGRIVTSHTTGTFTSFQYLEAVTLCRTNAHTLFQHYRNILKNYVPKNTDGS